MESIKEIFKIGRGPSSSHTMAPALASEQFLERNKGASFFSVTLYGSLAATGEGHMTDKAILDVLGKERTKILWEPETFLPQHPNGLRFESYDNEGETMESWTTFSIGGGDLSDSGERKSGTTVYPHSKMKDILEWCQANGRTFWEYVDIHEENDVWDYLAEVWKAMTDSVERGLDKEGVLPGGLNLSRKAASFYIKAKGYQGSMQRRSMTFSFALAVSEENASGGIVVTAPTCGSSGVLPGLLYLNRKFYDFSDSRIIKAIATAGLIGNIIKTNASISGAEVGCQGEVGSACAMAAGAGVQLFGGTPAQIEYAASIGIEHFLGLTCDPVCGLVQIPCIERNAFGATRAVDANMYALLSDGKHLVSFDTVVEAMKRTGHDLPRIYKETAAGGLAELVGKV
ncbi:MAG: L-serine ammonia-lyase [Bacteroidetes bacterium GWF2_40_14]|nr:MAG: L-serine ammonia-lyase [Bacteroidetes bacterium GWF2_40_14]